MVRNTRYSVSNSPSSEGHFKPYGEEDAKYSGTILASSPFYEEEPLEPDNWTEKDVIDTGLSAVKQFSAGLPTKLL